MANFCKFCGTPLADGQVCGCQGAQQAAYQAQQAYQAPVATAAPAAPAGNGFGKKLSETLKSYWQSPKTTAYNAAGDKDGMKVAGVFAGINFLAVFFFLWRIIGLLLSTVAKTGKVDVSELKDMIDIQEPIFPMLVAGLAVAVLGILATALVIFLAAKLNKQTVDFKQLIVIEAVHSIIPSALLLVGIVLGFLVWWLQFAVLAIILVLWFINICNDIRDITGAQIMESGKSLTTYALIIFAVLAVAVWAMFAIGGWGVGELSIEDMTINEAIEEAGSILEVMGDMF